MEKNFLRKYKGYTFYESSPLEGMAGQGRFDIETPDGSPGFSNFFSLADAHALNRVIEVGKEWVNKKAKSIPVAELTAREERKQRKCRVCGCTEDNCQQCIDKTGSPCHWIEKDLCSACVEEPVIKVEDKRAAVGNIDQAPLESIVGAGFFTQLASQGDIDLTLRIFIKNGKYTMSVLPGNTTAKVKPINITGTPESLDSDFFTTVFPGVKEVAGLISNLEEVKKDAADKVAKKKSEPAPGANKKSLPVKKAAPKKKTAPVKKVAPKKAGKKVTAKKQDVKKAAGKKAAVVATEVPEKTGEASLFDVAEPAAVS